MFVFWIDINFKDVIKNTYMVGTHGEIMYKDSEIVLNKKVTNTGYYAVSLRTKKRGNQWFLIHQLVATHFVNKPQNITDELVPDHIDDNHLNNYYENLQWLTRPENTRKGHITGAINNIGENNGSAKITDQIVHNICHLLEKNKSYTQIINELNLGDTKQMRTLLVRIKNKIKWKHISDLYNIDSENTMLPEKHKLITENINEIKKMLSVGYSNGQIVDNIWGKNDSKRKSHLMTINNIRKKKIFKEYL